MKTGRKLIEEERKRQIQVEGWTPEHDKQYSKAELFYAASCYAAAQRCRAINQGKPYIPDGWPFDLSWWKPTPDDRIKECMKAGALYMAHEQLTGFDCGSYIEMCAKEIDELLAA